MAARCSARHERTFCSGGIVSSEEPACFLPPLQERYLDELAEAGRGTLLADDGLGFAGGEGGYAAGFMDGG